jgi:hypothetical protein
MDHFEQELARMMRDSQEDTPYEDRYRYRLQAGVRARRRARMAWMATGSVLTVAGLGVGLVVLPSSFAQGGPADPQPRPVTSAESASMPSTARPASTAKEVPTSNCTSATGPVPEPMPTCTSTTRPAPMPYRLSTPETVPMPTRISTTR